MKVRVFRVSGFMKIRREWQKFSLELTGVKREDVVEQVYSLLGSRHKLKRAHIRIVEVKEISPEEVQSPRLRDLIKTDKIVLFAR